MARSVVRIPEFHRDAEAVAAKPGSTAMLAALLADHARIVVLTGAGISTASGIPAYRSEDGRWQRRAPIFYQDFIGDARVRRRYWARSFFGWPVMRDARPGPAHRALARLAQVRPGLALITQNVDGLHQAAGQRDALELHGGLAGVTCLDCGQPMRRETLQHRLERLNPDWLPEVTAIRPDGDAELDERAWPGFRVADCERCGGRLKPDVVFFGESVPSARLSEARRLIEQADAVLVVGSSLVVGSAYGLVRRALARGLPVAAINRGRTRADAALAFKLDADCGAALGIVLTTALARF